MNVNEYVFKMHGVLDSFAEFCKENPEGLERLSAAEWDEQFMAYLETDGAED